MRKREQLLWDAMRRHFPSNAWLQRVENVAGEGMPDVYMGGNGKWIELKAVARIPINRHAAVLKKDGMRQSQINWHIRNASLKHAALSCAHGLPADIVQSRAVLRPDSLQWIIATHQYRSRGPAW